MTFGCAEPVDLEALPPIPTVNTSGMEVVVSNQISSALDALHAKPDSAKRNGMTGMIFHVYGYFNEADSLYTRAQALQPKNERWFYYQALVNQKSGDIESAKDNFQTALALAPNNSIIHIAYADALAELGETQAAQTYYEELLKHYEEQLEIWHGYGRLLRQRGSHEASIKAYQKVIDLGGHFGPAYFGIAQNYQQLGNQEQAQRYLTLRAQHKNSPLSIKDTLGQELRRLDRSQSARQKIVRKLVEADRVDDAIKLLKTIIREDPDNARTHISLIGLYTSKDQHKQTEHHINEALRIDRNLPKLHFNIGTYHLKNGRFKEAAQAYSESIEFDPENVDTIVRLGMAYENLGDNEKAQSVFQQALSKNSEHREANFLLGRQLARSNRYDQALPLLQKSTEKIDGRQAVYLNVLARTQALSGDYTAALASISAAMNLIDESTSAELSERIRDDATRIQTALETSNQ